MADGFTVDASEARALAADLGRIPARAIPEVDGVLEKAANVLKKDMAAAFAASPHFKRVAAAVSYERKGSFREIAYEVGPETGRGAGSLAGIAVDGGANGGGGSVKIDGLLESEAAVIERHIGDIIEGLL
ncbi:hypothetical protein GCM10027059_25840 [Myceligenerans halotolerans]